MYGIWRDSHGSGIDFQKKGESNFRCPLSDRTSDHFLPCGLVAGDHAGRRDSTCFAAIPVGQALRHGDLALCICRSVCDCAIQYLMGNPPSGPVCHRGDLHPFSGIFRKQGAPCRRGRGHEPRDRRRAAQGLIQERGLGPLFLRDVL